MHIASSVDDSKCLPYLLYKGQSPNLLCNSGSKQSPLHFSAFNDTVTNTKLLIKRGAKTNVRDKLGNTPMHQAMSYEKLEIVKVLD
mmetsp:Transcript_4811/g.6224  ORF Transcript_4811/g.6224 Transcript_4811/m.6224 type:complete len:86 (+) Transcript_4811:36-293(+)